MTTKKAPRPRSVRKPTFRPHVEWLEDRTTPATFTVTTAADVVAADSVLSLREAITAANDLAGADTINFNIGGGGAQTIRPMSLLPFVTGPTVLDATTQPGYAGKPIIELDGSLVATGCLILTGGSSTVRGFVINRFTSTEGPTVGIAVLGEGKGGNVIEGNYIGTNLAGDAIFSFPGEQISYGIIVRNAGNVIRNNVLSGNNTGGILLQNVGQGDSANNLITGNLIGTDWTGMADLGNGRYGVFFIGAGNGNRIEGNVLSGNNEGGMFIDSDNNVVLGNKIGVAADGRTPLGNGLGIWIAGGRNNTIGGTASGAGNVIAFNRGHGVFLSHDALFIQPTGNAIRGNSIFGNGLLGIDLAHGSPRVAGVTPNDTGDADTGPNDLQNFPILESAEARSDGSLFVVLSLNSRPNTTYTIDFYASDSADPSGHGEGQRCLGSAVVTTDAAGNVSSVSVTLTGTLLPGEVVTATATDPAGNTSEFSPTPAHPSGPPPANSPATQPDPAEPVSPAGPAAPMPSPASPPAPQADPGDFARLPQSPPAPSGPAGGASPPLAAEPPAGAQPGASPAPDRFVDQRVVSPAFRSGGGDAGSAVTEDVPEAGLPAEPASEALLGVAFTPESALAAPLTERLAEAEVAQDGLTHSAAARRLPQGGSDEGRALFLLRSEGKALRLGSALADADDSVVLIEAITDPGVVSPAGRPVVPSGPGASRGLENPGPAPERAGEVSASDEQVPAVPLWAWLGDAAGFAATLALAARRWWTGHFARHRPGFRSESLSGDK